MISDLLINWRSIPGLTNDPIWVSSFEWIEKHAENSIDGFHEVGIDGVYVRVMQYETKSRNLACYEAHKNTIDLQYTIDGAEGIEVNLLDNLITKNEYNADKDVQHFDTPNEGQVLINNVKGRFTILFPQDAHMPQLKVSNFSKVRKLVVKIPLKLILK